MLMSGGRRAVRERSAAGGQQLRAGGRAVLVGAGAGQRLVSALTVYAAAAAPYSYGCRRASKRCRHWSLPPPPLLLLLLLLAAVIAVALPVQQYNGGKPTPPRHTNTANLTNKFDSKYSKPPAATADLCCCCCYCCAANAAAICCCCHLVAAAAAALLLLLSAAATV